jgi:hypothetical protein
VDGGPLGNPGQCATVSARITRARLLIESERLPHSLIAITHRPGVSWYPCAKAVMHSGRVPALDAPS